MADTVASDFDLKLNELTDATVVALIVDPTATAFQQAGISSIDLDIYHLDSTTPTTSIYSDTPNVAATIFDTLQTDGYWDRNDEGYNFRHAITTSDLTAASVTLQGGNRYRVIYKLTTASFGNVYLRGTLTLRSIF